MAQRRQTFSAIPFYRNIRILTVLAQVAFAGAVISLGWLLCVTMLANLERQGIPISFAFLSQPAGFGISEGPAFDPAQSYLTAFAVGVANTLRVAVVGIVLATLLGLAIGIARLSRNWLLARLATIYVEVFRNVPLLLWLVFAYAALRVSLPHLRRSVQVFGDVMLLSNRGIAFAWPRASATFGVLVPWVAAALLLGLVAWLLVRRQFGRAGRERRADALKTACLVTVMVSVAGFILTPYVARLPAQARIDAEARRVFLDANTNGAQDAGEPGLSGLRVRVRMPGGTWTTRSREDGSLGEVPASVALHDARLLPGAPLFWSVPRVQGFRYQGGMVISPEFTALLLGLVIYTAAFIAEVVRAGIQAVPVGQREAANALGLSEAQTFRFVILPQALRVIIPPLINQYLNLTKNSSLAIAVGYPDLFSIGLTINNQTGQAIPFVIMIMTVYLSMSLLTSLVLNLLNRRLMLKTS